MITEDLSQFTAVNKLSHMPTKPWFRPINDDSNPALNTWVFEIGGVRYQLDGPKKRPKTMAFPRIKPNVWETPEGLKQQDFKTFIKHISRNQREKPPQPKSGPSLNAKGSKKYRPPRPKPPPHPGWSNMPKTGVFPNQWLIYRRPEGYGKSSLVENLLLKDKTVIFCSKSNKQLIAHEINFKVRYPNARIHRHISKAQHLSEYVEALTGHEFKLSTHPSISPYNQELVDVQASLNRLVELLGSSAIDVFRNEYEEWKALEIDGKKFHIILITLSAFQALCTGYRKTWWEHLNLSYKIYPEVDANGYSTSFSELEIKQRGYWKQKLWFKEEYIINEWRDEKFGPFIDFDWMPDPKGKEIHYVRDPNDDGGRFVPINGIVIIVDDPDRTDFDWMRRIDGEENAAELYSLTNKKGNKRTHILAQRWEDYFEQRQERATFGFGIQRGTRRSRPMVVIFTTELVTAKFACKTFENLQTQMAERKKVRNSFQAALKEAIEQYTPKQPYHYAFSDYSPVSDATHCTLIYTDMVRKRNHAMLIPIILELKDKFPDMNLSFIANGLACEWNLMNVKGINTLNRGASVIKLSALHPHASLNLMVHFKDEVPKDIVLQLVADQANQAIGRNQGNRYSNFPTIVLCEPKYMGIEKLLRYKLTPWSSEHSQKPSMWKYAIEETEFEKWLKYRLSSSGRWFASSNVAEAYVETASKEQQEIYWKWRRSLLHASSARVISEVRSRTG